MAVGNRQLDNLLQATLSNRAEHDASANSPNLTSASCDLDLWSWSFRALPGGPLMPVCSTSGRFVFEIMSCAQLSARSWAQIW